MTVDIDDVEVGDIMFMGGHLVRRVCTRPSERTYRVNHEYRTWESARLGDPLPNGECQTAVGQACLILRPTPVQGPPPPATATFLTEECGD